MNAPSTKRASVALQCPCGHATQKILSELVTGMELPCPECGEPVILNSGYYGILVEELAHAYRIADEVQRKVRRS